MPALPSPYPFAGATDAGRGQSVPRLADSPTDETFSHDLRTLVLAAELARLREQDAAPPEDAAPA